MSLGIGTSLGRITSRQRPHLGIGRPACRVNDRVIPTILQHPDYVALRVLIEEWENPPSPAAGFEGTVSYIPHSSLLQSSDNPVNNEYHKQKALRPDTENIEIGPPLPRLNQLSDDAGHVNEKH